MELVQENSELGNLGCIWVGVVSASFASDIYIETCDIGNSKHNEKNIKVFYSIFKRSSVFASDLKIWLIYFCWTGIFLIYI